MKKIKELQVGETTEITLLVKSAEIKQTKAGKPYLFAVLTDGADDIQAQDWDFGNNVPPAKNSVLNVYGLVGEYMGKKQIKLNKFSTSDEDVSLFAPTGDVDLNRYWNEAKELIGSIGNEKIKDVVRRVFNDNAEAFKKLPAAKGMHHAFTHGLLKHTIDVTKKARALAICTPTANVDLVVGGALLHDMGKFWTYMFNGAVIEMTDNGQLLEHIMLGAMELNKYRTEENSDVLDLLLHIISSHHGELEYGSPTTPRFIEAVIVNYADGVDAKCQMIIEQTNKSNPNDKWTDKVWALGNRQMVNQAYINKVLED